MGHASSRLERPVGQGPSWLIQADAVRSYPLYERCGIEIERCGRRRCLL